MDNRLSPGRLPFDDELAPITTNLLFLNALAQVVADDLFGWLGDLHGANRVTRTSLAGGLMANYRRLEPFTAGDYPRRLVVGTANPNWCAVFECGWRGADVTAISVLAGRLQALGVMVSSAPGRGKATSRVWGRRQFWMYFPGPTRKRARENRTIDLVQDAGGWLFLTDGAVQPFEDTLAYEQRRKTERLTDQMLINYSAALGLRAFDDDFYSGPSFLVTYPGYVRPEGIHGSLEETREQLGYPPRPVRL